MSWNEDVARDSENYLAADNAALRERVKALEKSIVGAYRQARTPGDAACSRCLPYSELLIDGFVCWWHQGESMATAAQGTGEEE